MPNTVQTIISKRPSPYQKPRVLAVDECCNNRHVADLARRLLDAGALSACLPIWDQARKQSDGTVIHVRAGVTGGGPPDFDWGKPLIHYSYPDKYVAILVKANTSSYDVVFVSENVKLDPRGIRKLLRSECEPLKADDHLIALYKKGKTDYEQFCQHVFDKVIAWSFETPYHEELI